MYSWLLQRVISAPYPPSARSPLEGISVWLLSPSWTLVQTGPLEGMASWDCVPSADQGLSPWVPQRGGVGFLEGQPGVRRRRRLTLDLTVPLSTPSAQAASVGANSPSRSSPPTAASGLSSAAAATGWGRASLQSMKVWRVRQWQAVCPGSLASENHSLLAPEEIPVGLGGGTLGNWGHVGRAGGGGRGTLEQGRAFSLTSPFSHLTLCPQSHLRGRCEKGQWSHPVAQLPR